MKAWKQLKYAALCKGFRKDVCDCVFVLLNNESRIDSATPSGYNDKPNLESVISNETVGMKQLQDGDGEKEAEQHPGP